MNREVTWDLIPCPILPPSLISHTVSMDVVKHRGRRKKLQLANQLAFSSHSPLDGEKGERRYGGGGRGRLYTYRYALSPPE